MVLIDVGNHQLQRFEQPTLESGIWYLVEFREVLIRRKKSQTVIRKLPQPFPVLLDLHRQILIYGYGLRKIKPVVFHADTSGCISTAHLFSGDLLTGIYTHDTDRFSLSLRYTNALEFSVYSEFKKKVQNIPIKESNGD